jgi:hypothetical protein
LRHWVTQIQETKASSLDEIGSLNFLTLTVRPKFIQLSARIENQEFTLDIAFPDQSFPRIYVEMREGR